MALAELAEAIDGLFSEGAASCADRESMIEAHRLFRRFEAFLTDAVGAFDVSAAWADDGARTPAAWLTARCRLPRAQAKREVSRASHLAHLPRAAGEFRGGGLGSAQVDLLCRLDRPPTDELLKRDEELLVDQAKELPVADFTRALSYWEQLADPDGTEGRAERARTRRDVTLSQSVFGTWLGTITLDPVGGTIVAEELARIERVLFEADRSEARAQLGRDPLAHQLARTSAQRRADALIEMATRSKVASETHRRPTPLFTVLVDYPTLSGRICELAQGAVVTPGSLVPYLDEAIVERAVFSPDGRVEIGARQRLFGGATRRAVEVRDRRCSHPLCDLPADWCQVDHIEPASWGGPTTQANGRLLCPFHNRLAYREYVQDHGSHSPPGSLHPPPDPPSDGDRGAREPPPDGDGEARGEGEGRKRRGS